MNVQELVRETVLCCKAEKKFINEFCQNAKLCRVLLKIIVLLISRLGFKTALQDIVFLGKKILDTCCLFPPRYSKDMGTGKTMQGVTLLSVSILFKGK